MLQSVRASTLVGLWSFVSSLPSGRLRKDLAVAECGMRIELLAQVVTGNHRRQDTTTRGDAFGPSHSSYSSQSFKTLARQQEAQLRGIHDGTSVDCVGAMAVLALLLDEWRGGVARFIPGCGWTRKQNRSASARRRGFAAVQTPRVEQIAVACLLALQPPPPTPLSGTAAGAAGGGGTSTTSGAGTQHVALALLTTLLHSCTVGDMLRGGHGLVCPPLADLAMRPLIDMLRRPAEVVGLVVKARAAAAIMLAANQPLTNAAGVVSGATDAFGAFGTSGASEKPTRGARGAEGTVKEGAQEEQLDAIAMHRWRGGGLGAISRWLGLLSEVRVG